MNVPTNLLLEVVDGKNSMILLFENAQFVVAPGLRGNGSGMIYFGFVGKRMPTFHLELDNYSCSTFYVLVFSL